MLLKTYVYWKSKRLRLECHSVARWEGGREGGLEGRQAGGREGERAERRRERKKGGRVGAGLQRSPCARVRTWVQAAFLMPAGVIFYTVAGLKATFLASYLHTVVIYLALCIFSMNVYATGPHLGSPGKVRVPSSLLFPWAGTLKNEETGQGKQRQVVSDEKSAKRP